MLTMNRVKKSFRGRIAVEDVSLRVKKGETVVIMGPSGCGKSTTIRMVNRLVMPDSGEILFEGRDLLQLSEEELRRVRKRIGFVFQQFHLIERLSAEENVMLGLVMDGMEREEARARARAALRKVGLEERGEARPQELSGGQQQRVGIARALVFEPPLMLWDEPTASLDPILVREVLSVMEELSRYRAASMLVVTHELAFAAHAADHILLMEHGRIAEEGTPEEIFCRPQSAIGRQYKELMEYQRRMDF